MLSTIFSRNLYLPKFYSFLSLLLSLSVLLFLFSCQDENTLENRLNHFYTLLSPPVVEDFKKGNLQSGVDYINQKYQADEEFETQFDDLKKKEAIEFLSTEDILEYYYRFFYLQIEKAKNKS